MSLPDETNVESSWESVIPWNIIMTLTEKNPREWYSNDQGQGFVHF